MISALFDRPSQSAVLPAAIAVRPPMPRPPRIPGRTAANDACFGELRAFSIRQRRPDGRYHAMTILASTPVAAEIQALDMADIPGLPY